MAPTYQHSPAPPDRENLEPAMTLRGQCCLRTETGLVSPTRPTFKCTGLSLFSLLILLILLVLRGAGPRVQLLQDGGAELLELSPPDPQMVTEVVSSKEVSRAEALRWTGKKTETKALTQQHSFPRGKGKERLNDQKEQEGDIPEMDL